MTWILYLSHYDCHRIRPVYIGSFTQCKHLRECEEWWNWVMANAKHFSLIDLKSCSFSVPTSLLAASCFFFMLFSKWLESTSDLNIMCSFWPHHSLRTQPAIRHIRLAFVRSFVRSFNLSTHVCCLRFGNSVSCNLSGEFQWKHLPALIHRHIIANIIQFLGNPMFAGYVFVQCTSIQLSTRKYTAKHSASNTELFLYLLNLVLISFALYLFWIFFLFSFGFFFFQLFFFFSYVTHT